MGINGQQITSTRQSTTITISKFSYICASLIVYMLQVKLNLRLICFKTRSICFNLGHFFFFIFLRQTKNIYTFGIFNFHFLDLHSPYPNTYPNPSLCIPCSPNIPSPLFFSNLIACFISPESETFGFSLDSFSYALPIESY